MSLTQTNLSEDERVIWSGHGERVPWLVPADLFMVPFSLVWTGGAIAFAVSAAGEGIGFMAFSAVFVAIGVYVSVGRLFVRHRNWTRSRYTLTGDRVVVERNGKEESAWLDQLPPPVAAGKHVIGFGSNMSVQSKLLSEGWPMANMGNGGWPANQHPVIVGVEDAQALRKQISTAQNEARRGRRSN